MTKWTAALRLTGVGFYIVVCIIAGVVAGLWLDDKLNTRPILVIVGLLVGVFLAFYGVYQMLLPLLNKRNKENS